MPAARTPDPALVDAVARRVIELLDAPSSESSGELLTVAEVAARYRVRPSWMYAHKRELGVIRLGDGPKPRLRFGNELRLAVGSRVRTAHRDIRATRGELGQLVLRLGDQRPVHPVGVALVSVLVSEPGGPLCFSASEPDALWREVQAARAALDRVWTEPV